MQKNYKENHLKPYAIKSINSKGRIYNEKENSIRSPYQRDRDRIIHSSSFRRLKHKTQVFVNTEGDHYRTRLTHSMEVSQISRTLARSLGLNEDLCETLSLSHDLGHTPFGHAGEEVLNQCMKKHGGFIPGIRPGKKTSEFIDNILTRVTLPGSFFLAFVAVFPFILMQTMDVNYSLASFFGGTSLLIIVGVALDTLQQVESHLLMRHYDGFLKKGKIRGRRRS